jgi:phage terminase small subunit
MKINKKNVLASFVDYDQRTKDNLEIIIKEVSKQGKELSEYALVIFQLLAIQFDIYYKCYDELTNGNLTNERVIGDKTIYQPKPQLDMLQKTNVQISRFLKDLGLSPLERAKIKKLNDLDPEEQAEQAYDDLLK